jgi:hypothetical protein
VPRFLRRYGIPLVVVIGILLLTLAPASGDEPTWSGLCLICGGRGTADAILNVILFLPLGIAVGLRSRSVGQVIVIGFLLSGTIELIQSVIPGRYPTLGDVVSNTLGATLGAVVCAKAGRLLFPDLRLSNILVVAWVALGGLILISMGILLRPSYPDSAYFGQWTPDLGHLGHYDGRVLAFDIGGQSVPKGKVADSSSIRSALLRPGIVRVQAIAGSRADRLSSLVSIYDERQREILLVGPDRDDLAYRYRTRAAALRLDAPAIRFRGAMAGVAAGDTLRVEVRPSKRGICISVNGASMCGLGYTIGSGPAILHSLDGFPRTLVILINAIGLAVLVFPGAYWARTGLAKLLYGLALAAGLVLTPGMVGLATTTPVELVGASAGLVLGYLLGGRVGLRDGLKGNNRFCAVG